MKYRISVFIFLSVMMVFISGCSSKPTPVSDPVGNPTTEVMPSSEPTPEPTPETEVAIGPIKQELQSVMPESTPTTSEYFYTLTSKEIESKFNSYLIRCNVNYKTELNMIELEKSESTPGMLMSTINSFNHFFVNLDPETEIPYSIMLVTATDETEQSLLDSLSAIIAVTQCSNSSITPEKAVKIHEEMTKSLSKKGVVEQRFDGLEYTLKVMDAPENASLRLVFTINKSIE